MRRALMWSTLLGAVLAAGCLVGETTHTLHLDPDGTVDWTVLERDIRSDAEEPGERRAEEADYLQAALAGAHPVALALDRLGAREVHAEVLRTERPFDVRTTARFDRAERMLESLLDGLGIVGTARLEQQGGERILRVEVDVAATDAASEGGDEALHPLVGDPGDYRVVLTRGRFVAAEGFELSADHTVAVPQPPDEDRIAEDGGIVIFALRWIAD